MTAFTISLDTPDAMAAAAARAAHRPLLKVKLGRDGDRERLRAVRDAAPTATLIVDANEAWRPADLEAMLAACQEAGVWPWWEQPLPAGDDGLLAHVPHPVPIVPTRVSTGARGWQRCGTATRRSTSSWTRRVA